jgi:hypothetical protein
MGTYTSHEQAECTAQRESHCTGDGGLGGTGFHCGVHLSFTLACTPVALMSMSATNRLDHCLLLVTHALHVVCSSHAADGRSHSWEAHVGVWVSLGVEAPSAE